MKHVPSTSSANLDDYLTRQKEDSDLPRVVYEWGQNCRPETAKDEFRALREEHGAQGAVRRVPARYVGPSDPADATHLKVGKNWRAAKEGEVATHQKIEVEGLLVKRAEAYHYIISFGLDEVDPDDPQQTQLAFESVVAMWEQDYAGTQAKLVAHGDATGSQVAQELGESGKFHVHVMANAVMHTGMAVDDRAFRPGMRMAGPLTHVDRMRERHDAFLQARGHEFGLGAQRLPAPRSKEARAVRNTQHDFHERERRIQHGGDALSDHDRARAAVEDALEALTQEDLAGLGPGARKLCLADAVKSGGDVELKLRTTKAGDVKLRSYVVADRKQALGGTRLGDRYSDAGLDEQLELVAEGAWKPYARPRAGPAKQVRRLPDAGVAELQREVDALAERELEVQAAEQTAQRMDRTASGPEPSDAGLAAVGEKKEAARALMRAAFGSGLDRASAVELVGSDLAPVSAEPVQRAEPVRPEQPAPERAGLPEPAAAARPARRQEGPATAPAEKVPVEPVKPVKRAERPVGVLRREQMHDVEFVAVVMGERGDGGAYIDFQVAAGDPLATGRPGLHLHAKNVDRADRQSGSTRKVTETWRQLSAGQYDRLKAAAGENCAEVNGRRVLGLSGDIMPTVKGGYVANPNTLQSSRLARVGPDVLDRQRASEDRAREVQKDEPSRAQLAFDSADAVVAQPRSRGHGLGD